jgi:hypothetical protein
MRLRVRENPAGFKLHRERVNAKEQPGKGLRLVARRGTIPIKPSNPRQKSMSIVRNME